MNDIRRNGIIGLIEYETPSANYNQQYCHFSEWWNGEGIDFTFSDKNGERRISLHLDDITALVTAAIASDFVDIDYCNNKAAELNASSKKRAQDILDIQILNNIAGKQND